MGVGLVMLLGVGLVMLLGGGAGAANNLLKFNILRHIPEVIIGDFDSVRTNVLDYYRTKVLS